MHVIVLGDILNCEKQTEFMF